MSAVGSAASTPTYKIDTEASSLKPRKDKAPATRQHNKAKTGRARRVKTSTPVPESGESAAQKFANEADEDLASHGMVKIILGTDDLSVPDVPVNKIEQIVAILRSRR